MSESRKRNREGSDESDLESVEIDMNEPAFSDVEEDYDEDQPDEYGNEEAFADGSHDVDASDEEEDMEFDPPASSFGTGGFSRSTTGPFSSLSAQHQAKRPFAPSLDDNVISLDSSDEDEPAPSLVIGSSTADMQDIQDEEDEDEDDVDDDEADMEIESFSDAHTHTDTDTDTNNAVDEAADEEDTHTPHHEPPQEEEGKEGEEPLEHHVLPHVPSLSAVELETVVTDGDLVKRLKLRLREVEALRSQAYLHHSQIGAELKAQRSIWDRQGLEYTATIERLKMQCEERERMLVAERVKTIDESCGHAQNTASLQRQMQELCVLNDALMQQVASLKSSTTTTSSVVAHSAEDVDKLQQLLEASIVRQEDLTAEISRLQHANSQLERRLVRQRGDDARRDSVLAVLGGESAHGRMTDDLNTTTTTTATTTGADVDTLFDDETVGVIAELQAELDITSTLTPTSGTATAAGDGDLHSLCLRQVSELASLRRLYKQSLTVLKQERQHSTGLSVLKEENHSLKVQVDRLETSMADREREHSLSRHQAEESALWREMLGDVLNSEDYCRVESPHTDDDEELQQQQLRLQQQQQRLKQAELSPFEAVARVKLLLSRSLESMLHSHTNELLLDSCNTQVVRLTDEKKAADALVCVLRAEAGELQVRVRQHDIDKVHLEAENKSMKELLDTYLVEESVGGDLKRKKTPVENMTDTDTDAGGVDADVGDNLSKHQERLLLLEEQLVISRRETQSLREEQGDVLRLRRQLDELEKELERCVEENDRLRQYEERHALDYDQSNTKILHFRLTPLQVSRQEEMRAKTQVIDDLRRQVEDLRSESQHCGCYCSCSSCSSCSSRTVVEKHTDLLTVLEDLSEATTDSVVTASTATTTADGTTPTKLSNGRKPLTPATTTTSSMRVGVSGSENDLSHELTAVNAVNQDLLQRLKTDSQSLLTVSQERDAAVAKVSEIEKHRKVLLREKDEHYKTLSKLKDVFKAKATEFRECVRQLTGFKVSIDADNQQYLVEYRGGVRRDPSHKSKWERLTLKVCVGSDLQSATVTHQNVDICSPQYNTLQAHTQHTQPVLPPSVVGSFATDMDVSMLLSRILDLSHSE